MESFCSDLLATLGQPLLKQKENWFCFYITSETLDFNQTLQLVHINTEALH